MTQWVKGLSQAWGPDFSPLPPHPACTYQCLGGDKKILELYQLDSVAQMTRSGFSEKPCLRNGWRDVKEYPINASSGLHIVPMGAPTHIGIQYRCVHLQRCITQVHTHTHQYIQHRCLHMHRCITQVHTHRHMTQVRPHTHTYVGIQ